MNLPTSVKPALWGAAGGALAAIVVGFAWGGWVTGGTAGAMASTSAGNAVVQAFTPLCVARAEEQPEQLLLLKEESTWKRTDFVVKAGWVDNVSDKYRSAVAKDCAAIVVEATEASLKPAG